MLRISEVRKLNAKSSLRMRGVSPSLPLIGSLFVCCNKQKMAGSFFWGRSDDLSEVEKAVIGDTVPTEAIEVGE